MIDPHFHFLDPVGNPQQHATLLKAHPELQPYLPEDYAEDFAGLDVVKAVHMEVIPDDFEEEVQWVQGLHSAGRCPWLGGIVAAADPSAPDFERVLQGCVAASPLVRGVRWILNWDGPLEPGETPVKDRATWPRVAKRDYFSDAVFAAQYPLLEKYGLSFDLQCNPTQLEAAATFVARFPGIPVVLDHIGSLRLSGDHSRDEAALAVWHRGMRALASVPHVHVKLSFLGYTTPGWARDDAKTQVVRDLVRGVIALFGAERCMFASNFPVDRDPDGGCTARAMYGHYRAWVAQLPDKDQRALFRDTAAHFYRIDVETRVPRALEAAGSAPASPPARIAVCGAGWWAQGWHLPQLHRNPNAHIAAIIEPCPTPRSTLNPDIRTTAELTAHYGAPVFRSIDELLAAPVAASVDGIIVVSEHATHYDVGMKALKAGWHILMEKPMTTDPKEAHALAAAAATHDKVFMVNNSANFREQTRRAHNLVAAGEVGRVQHVSCSLLSNLKWLFEDPANVGWVKPSGTMAGNGFGWGQSSHVFAWVYFVTGLAPVSVFCHMSYSDKSGADIYNSATIRCACGATIAVTGAAGIPGPTKKVTNVIFGTEGTLTYNGNSPPSGAPDPESGALALQRHDGREQTFPGFYYENLQEDGYGPESLQAFISGCRGGPFFNAADATVGLRAVLTIDAMYRSAQSGRAEDVLAAP